MFYAFIKKKPIPTLYWCCAISFLFLMVGKLSFLGRTIFRRFFQLRKKVVSPFTCWLLQSRGVVSEFHGRPLAFNMQIIASEFWDLLLASLTPHPDLLTKCLLCLVSALSGPGLAHSRSHWSGVDKDYTIVLHLEGKTVTLGNRLLLRSLDPPRGIFCMAFASSQIFLGAFCVFWLWWIFLSLNFVENAICVCTVFIFRVALHTFQEEKGRILMQGVNIFISNNRMFNLFKSLLTINISS